MPSLPILINVIILDPSSSPTDRFGVELAFNLICDFIFIIIFFFFSLNIYSWNILKENDSRLIVIISKTLLFLLLEVLPPSDYGFVWLSIYFLFNFFKAWSLGLSLQPITYYLSLTQFFSIFYFFPLSGSHFPNSDLIWLFESFENALAPFIFFEWHCCSSIIF